MIGLGFGFFSVFGLVGIHWTLSSSILLTSSQGSRNFDLFCQKRH